MAEEIGGYLPIHLLNTPTHRFLAGTARSAYLSPDPPQPELQPTSNYTSGHQSSTVRHGISMSPSFSSCPLVHNVDGPWNARAEQGMFLPPLTPQLMAENDYKSWIARAQKGMTAGPPMSQATTQPMYQQSPPPAVQNISGPWDWMAQQDLFFPPTTPQSTPYTMHAGWPQTAPQEGSTTMAYNDLDDGEFELDFDDEELMGIGKRHTSLKSLH